MNGVQYDAIVIGGGPAGLTAALYLARARNRVLVLEKEQFGGQIALTAEIVNYPGVEKTSGAELTSTMRKQAEAFGAECRKADVTSLDLDGDVKTVHTSAGDFTALSVLLATGTLARQAGFEGEEKFRGHGVTYCATCDGEFFSGRDVYVIGGGFAAAEESVFLAKYARHVTILIRGDDFSCAASTAAEAKGNEKIEVRYNTELVEAKGDTAIRELTLRDRKTGNTETVRADDGDFFGIFVFVGSVPATQLVKGPVELDERGYAIVDADQRTNVKGLFAAGDVCHKTLRQVVTAVGEGGAAATAMERYVKELKKETGLSVRPFEAADQKAPQRAVAEEAPAADVQSENAGFFDAGTRAQLDQVFSRMTGTLTLRVHPDDSARGRELSAFMSELAGLSDKIGYEQTDALGREDELPFVEVLHADGNPSGLEFHGVPGGHEFTPFVLGLYNVAGPGQPISEQDRAGIEAIERPIDIRIIVSLTCTMCPDLVTAAQRIAADNPQVTAHIYDVALFPDLQKRYNVMSVPCLIVDDETGERVEFGRKYLTDLLAFLG